MRSPWSLPALGVLLVVAAGAQTPPRYNQVQQKHSHNTYQRIESPLDIAIYYAVRSIELDIHISSRSGGKAVAKDWYVWHTKEGEHTSCDLLSTCLRKFASMSQAIPNHEPMTVWIELKDDKDAFDAQHTPDDLDNLFRQQMGAGRVFQPSNLQSLCPGAANLQASVTGACRWPDLSQLRGRFMFVILGGAKGTYKGDGYPGGRAAFVQGDAGNVSGDPSAVFFNVDVTNASKAQTIYTAGFVTRITEAETQGEWNTSWEQKSQFIGTDEVNFYTAPWSRTNNHYGWPFLCLDADCACRTESPAVVGINAVSKDIWGGSDNFTFLYERQPDDGGRTWSAFLSTPGSHVEPWAKGCVMARKDVSAGSPYFAVCRTAAEHPLRVQYRLEPNAETVRKEIALGPDSADDHHQHMFVTLRTNRNDSGQTCVSGYGSLYADDMSKILIEQKCFNTTLPLQGIGASSHADSLSAQSEPVKFLFGNVSKADATGTTKTYKAADFNVANIGDVYQSSVAVFDGLFPGNGWFAYQSDWGSRSSGVGYSGQSEWLADVTGDGKADHVYNHDGTQNMKVMASTGTSFGPDTTWGARAYGVGRGGKSEWVVGVASRDRADYVYNRDGTKELWVLVSTGAGFQSDQKWGARTYEVGHDGNSEWFADVNGDGRADYLYNREGTREMWVMTSGGTQFGPEQNWGSRNHPVGRGGKSQWLADVNGDGRADYVYNRDGTRELWVMTSDGTKFSSPRLWGERKYGVGHEGFSEWLADVTGDGKSDHIYNRDETRELWVMTSTGAAFNADAKWGERRHAVNDGGDSEWVVDLDG
ncbi:MAG TPA: Ca2+-dependent phosphoinositide-specific phospholipase C, partial [Pyrinomonadaceae bacterium]|nr:Ca2+-dependent phosphoinositide-specific phospholipase C [Pyrinomonadaceae bacterium]